MNMTDPTFSRTGCSHPNKTELRGLCPTELAQALDAIAMTKGLDRNAFVIQVLEAEVRRVLHDASVLHRALRGNPLMSDGNGVQK
jgi:hypothetical protein